MNFLVESGAFENFKSLNFSFEMAVFLTVQTEKVGVSRTFDTDGPEKMFVLSKVHVTLVCLNRISLTRLNAWPTIYPANVRTNELFFLSEFVLTRFECSCPFPRDKIIQYRCVKLYRELKH